MDNSEKTNLLDLDPREFEEVQTARAFATFNNPRPATKALDVRADGTTILPRRPLGRR